MRVVALVSGGKDSCYNMMQCVAAGHEIVALANLQPSRNEEIDSYMYQTVGHDGISMYSEAMGLPLYRRVIYGNAVVQDKEYSPTQGDEVEDLFVLLSDIKKEIDFDAIAVGAILSDYQRIRVENVCTRLGCVSLAYLWRRDQSELLQEMIDCGINAIIIKTASLGLDPDQHLGKSIVEMQAHLLSSKEKYGINVCGEGGEYETFTLDCALFQQAIVLDEYEKVIHSNDAFAPVGYLKLNKMHLVKKTARVTEIKAMEIDKSCRSSSQKDQLDGYPVKSPLDYLADLVECNKADCCDGHFEFCEKNNPNSGEGLDNKGFECTALCSKSGTHVQGGGDLETNLAITDVATEVSLSDVVVKEPISEPQGETTRPCQNQNVRETLSFPVTLRVTTNAGGWLWAMGIQGNEKYSGNNYGSTEDSNNPMRNALVHLRSILEERGLRLTDLIGVVMYVSNMEDYAHYNGEYNKFFASRPPVRICVEAPLPLDTPIVLEGLAFLPPFEGEGNTRQCMHVQGISHWAPANIGPYSQAIWVGDIIYVAGQIGLIPGSMKLVEGGARMECKLALRHINRVIKATDPKVELRDVVQGICYVTNCKFIEECRHEWEKRTNNAIVEYIVVPRLPRDAHVEWQIWAHKHNTAFEYEETGCYVGSGVKVRIIRRWNYENRVAAIVCRASISSDKAATANLGKEELIEMTEYALNKLLREADKTIELIDKSCSVRVFYRIGAVNPVDITESLESQSLKYSVAFSVLPVCSLVQENTLLSFCGVRHH